MERDWYLVGGAIGDAGLDAGACARGRRTGGMTNIYKLQYNTDNHATTKSKMSGRLSFLPVTRIIILTVSLAVSAHAGSIVSPFGRAEQPYNRSPR